MFNATFSTRGFFVDVWVFFFQEGSWITPLEPSTIGRKADIYSHLILAPKIHLTHAGFEFSN